MMMSMFRQQTLPENTNSPCARIFAVSIFSGTWQTDDLPCVCKKTHGKHQTHGEPRSSPCAKPQHTANSNLRRVPFVWHTANIILPSRAVQGPDGCHYLPCVQGDTWQTWTFVVCLALGTRRTRKKIHVFASKFFLHSPYFVWYSMFEYNIFIDMLVVFN